MRMRFVLAGLLAIPLLTAADDAPPRGWKEYSPKDSPFSVSLPGGKSISRSERERTVIVRGVRIKSNVVSAETRGGLILEVSMLVLPARLVRVSQREKIEIIRNTFVSETAGRLTGESDITLGEATGKEYTVQTMKGMARLRVFVRDGQIYSASVLGKNAQVASKTATTFLESCKVSAKAADAAAKSPAAKRK